LLQGWAVWVSLVSISRTQVKHNIRNLYIPLRSWSSNYRENSFWTVMNINFTLRGARNIVVSFGIVSMTIYYKQFCWRSWKETKLCLIQTNLIWINFNRTKRCCLTVSSGFLL
jgi:hypothetical protein